MLFSKTYPSFLTVKEGSTSLTKPLFPQGREDVAGYAIASARVLVSSAEPVPTRGCRWEFNAIELFSWISAALSKLKASFLCIRLHEICDCLSAGALRTSHVIVLLWNFLLFFGWRIANGHSILIFFTLFCSPPQYRSALVATRMGDIF